MDFKETITTEQLHDDMQIRVCSNCRQASCWLGIFYCQEYKRAGIVNISVGKLRELKLESPDYWAKEIRSRYGRD